MLNYKNKIICITGSNGQLGKFISRGFLNLGAKLILIDKDKVSKVKNKNITYFQCEFTSRLEKENLIKLIKKKFKHIDILINNAALTGNELYKNKDSTKELYFWDKSLEVNLTSTNKLIYSLKPLLAKSRYPSIINIGSLHGVISPDNQLYTNTNIKNYASYSVSKSSIIHLTKWYASQLAPKIRVNCISPGGIYRGQPKLFVNRYISKTPLKRMAKLNDVFGSILFLSSDLSSYITGQNILLDGGYSIV